ncbi:SLC13 family permease [Luteithermobacter gelatinilyticus]|uniref:SLC13 family permease n=1 Tax=Luteithermobacter gelatinilyticus TaxID=2582913 RepID=UPI001106AE93|nr:SLC13 family permease [Luteithermobacter gelatinilyticus]
MTFSAETHLLITLGVLLALFVAFVLERVPAHLSAMTATTVLLVTGTLSTEDVLATFSNPAPMTIACMFVITAALEGAGVIDALGRFMLGLAERHKGLALLGLFFGVMVASAFMNNTPVVIVMVPVMIALAQKLGDYPSKYLMPLSFVAIFGGTCTLIGTSTNLLVDGVARSHGFAGFGMFEMSLAGLCLAAAGGIYLMLVGRRVLPDYPLLIDQIGTEEAKKRFVADAMILGGSSVIGKTLNELNYDANARFRIVDLIRGDAGVRRSIMAPESGAALSALRDTPLQEGDRLIFKTDKGDLERIRSLFGLSFDTERKTNGMAGTGAGAGVGVSVPARLGAPLVARETVVAEGVLGKSSRLVGKNPATLRLRRRYGCYLLAIHRRNENITASFDNIVLREGDVLLFEGPREELDKLFENENILRITHLKGVELDRPKAVLAVMALGAVVGLAALNVMPIAGLALSAAVFLVLTGCVGSRKAYEAIDWRILLLIYGTLAVSTAMEKSGAAQILVSGLMAALGEMGPVMLLGGIYLLTSLLTEVMSNNAAAVLIAPLAIGLAESLGVDARPFLVAVMFGASASFATPIGYQTNTIVYSAGGYRFADFLKIGIPLNILMLLVSVGVIPLFWSF